MKFSLPIISKSANHFYHHRDVISINFRQFRMKLMQSRLPEENYELVKVTFRWTDSARTYNQKDRHNGLPEAAISMVDNINQFIGAASCTVIFAQISKLFCEVVIAAPHSQEVYGLLKEMHSPQGFSGPEFEDSRLTPSQFVAQYPDQ